MRSASVRATTARWSASSPQGELFSLAELNRWGGPKRDRLEELLNELVIVDVTSNARPTLEKYAELDVFSHRLGKPIGKNDLWIAATAVATESLLLTTDHDFVISPRST